MCQAVSKASTLTTRARRPHCQRPRILGETVVHADGLTCFQGWQSQISWCPRGLRSFLQGFLGFREFTGAEGSGEISISSIVGIIYTYIYMVTPPTIQLEYVSYVKTMVLCIFSMVEFWAISFFYSCNHYSSKIAIFKTCHKSFWNICKSPF